MVRIAVCDDERTYANFICKGVEVAINQMELESEIEVFRSGVLLLNAHRKAPYDVLFLDIDMPNMSGFELAKEVRDVSIRTFIIFVTAKTDLVYSSFDYQPFGFICKSDNSINNDILKVVKRLNPFYKQSRLVAVNDNYVSIDIPINSIVYIQSDKHYVLYFTSDRKKDAPIRERNTITLCERFYSDYDFIKPHSRYLLNMTHIQNFDVLQNTIIMDNEDMIPISKKFKAEALDKYRKFRRR